MIDVCRSVVARVGLVAFVAITSAVVATSESTERERSQGSEPMTDFIVGVEDQLGVVVWGEPTLSRSVRVRPDGKISIPLVNDIKVAGMTPEAIRKIIAEKLATFIREPNVTVIVEEINSFKVYFLGEVRNQGVIPFYRPTRLLHAIAAAGGLTDFAKREITLIRESRGTERRISVDFKRLLSGDPDQENIYLQPGDMLLFR